MTARARQVTEQIQQWLRRRLGTDNKYHPERHYMRGPGPKCIAKSGGQIPDAAKAAPRKSRA